MLATLFSMKSDLPLAFLWLLFVGTVCNSMAVSFMGFYIVETLGRAPWSISVYTGCFALVVIHLQCDSSHGRRQQWCAPFFQ